MATDLNNLTVTEGLQAGALALTLVFTQTEGPVQGVAVSALMLIEQVQSALEIMSAEAQEESN